VSDLDTSCRHIRLALNLLEAYKSAAALAMARIHLEEALENIEGVAASMAENDRLFSDDRWPVTSPCDTERR